MLDRGKKIVVTKSSAKGKQHPSVGDIGYIRNAVLFPTRRFILTDIFFCSFGKQDKNTNRCEKKRFIIDLGINQDTKQKLSKGVSRMFFNRNYVNLNCIDYLIPYTEVPNVIAGAGIFERLTTNSNIKIPFGHIAYLDDRTNLAVCNIGEFRSWINSLLTVACYSGKFFTNRNLKTKVISLIPSNTEINRYVYIAKKQIDEKYRDSAVRCIRYEQATNKKYVESMLSSLICSAENNIEMKNVKDLSKVIVSDTTNGIVAKLFIHILFESYTKSMLINNLLRLKNNTYIKLSDKQIGFLVNKVFYTESKIHKSSAALDRFFREYTDFKFLSD